MANTPSILLFFRGTWRWRRRIKGFRAQPPGKPVRMRIYIYIYIYMHINPRSSFQGVSARFRTLGLWAYLLLAATKTLLSDAREPFCAQDRCSSRLLSRLGAQSGCSSMLLCYRGVQNRCSESQRRSRMLFEEAVQRIYSKSCARQLCALFH